MKYVMSDIHGCFKEFMTILERINFSEHDEMYIIGDAIDRGPDPIKLLQYIMQHNNIHLVMGNHEKMMIDELNGFNEKSSKYYTAGCWKLYGGQITYSQFQKLKKEDRKVILNFLIELPLVKEVNTDSESYILLHGGPGNDFKTDWESGKISEEVLWTYFDNCSAKDIVYPGKIIVVGHMPTFNYGYDDKIIFIGDKRLIDCGCIFGYSLGCLCLDTQETFYVKKGGS